VFEWYHPKTTWAVWTCLFIQMLDQSTKSPWPNVSIEDGHCHQGSCRMLLRAWGSSKSFLRQGIVSTLWSWHMLKLGSCNFSFLILNVVGDVDGMDGKCFHVVSMVWTVTVWRVWMIWIVWIVWNNMDLLMEMNTDRWVIYLIWILNNTTTHPVLPDLGLWNDSQVGTQFWKCEGFDTSQQVDWFFTCFEHPP